MSLPDQALVVRGGAAFTPDGLARALGVHPSGVAGWSVESAAGLSLAELCRGVVHRRVGVTTVGAVRALGGDVIPTAGRSASHATLTGLSPEQTSGLLNPSVPNPVPRDRRAF